MARSKAPPLNPLPVTLKEGMLLRVQLLCVSTTAIPPTDPFQLGQVIEPAPLIVNVK